MSDDPRSDPFAPPEISTEVCCLHCGETYDSWQIEWRVLADTSGKERGFWCCPIAGCDGMGFGFDILPTDPEYQDERGGWVQDEDAEDDDEDDADWMQLELEEAGTTQAEDQSDAQDHGELPWDDDQPLSPPKPDEEFPFSMN